MSISTGHGQTYYPIGGVANQGVTWIEPNGFISSASINDPDVSAWLASNTPAAASPPSISAQIAEAIVAGLTITFTTTTALSGTYSLDPNILAEISLITNYVQRNSTFPMGMTTWDWRDSVGEAHTFPSTTLWIDWDNAITNYVAELSLIGRGLASGPLPSSSVTVDA